MPSTEPAVARALANYTALLAYDVTYDGWINETAKRKAFYIRGYTWFQENVLKHIPMNITECRTELPRAKEILLARKEWNTGQFGWGEKLAANQVHYAVSYQKRQPLLFSKAVEVMVVFEAIAENLSGFEPTDIYRHMRIEAAVSYINDFTVSTLDTMKSRDPAVFDKLRLRTGQESNLVFYDMANGKTVTHKLAVAVRDFVRGGFPDLLIGDVSFRYNRRNVFTPSANEDLDGNQPASLAEDAVSLAPV